MVKGSPKPSLTVGGANKPKITVGRATKPKISVGGATKPSINIVATSNAIKSDNKKTRLSLANGLEPENWF